MQPGTLKTLEFDRIVSAVERLAQTPFGAGRLAHLEPSIDPADVSSALATTAEAVRFLSGAGDIALRGSADLDAIVDGLSVEGRALEPLGLLTLSTFLASVEASAGAIRRAADRRISMPSSRGCRLKGARSSRWGC